MRKFTTRKSFLSPDLCDWNGSRVRPKGKIRIWDETLRDGMQQVGVFLTKEKRVALARKLDEVGVSFIDAGMPMVSREEVLAVRAVNREHLNAKVMCAVRTLKADVDSALDADCSSISTFVSCSLPRLTRDYKKSIEELSEDVVEVIEYSKDHGLEVAFVSEDTTRSHPHNIKILHEGAEKAGADMHIISDTVGSATPEGIRNLFRFLRTLKIKHPFAFHGHNDLGLAVINAIAASEEGCHIQHTTVLGMGERAGNTPFEELIINLHLRGWNHRIKLGKMQELAALVSRAYGIPILLNRPIVGENAYRHDSGIHVSGIMACGVEIYSAFHPETVGRHAEVVLGKGCGASNILYHRPTLDKETAALVAQRVKEKSYERGKRGKRAMVELRELDGIIKNAKRETKKRKSK
jgi:methanogen homocitrate synthase